MVPPAKILPATPNPALAPLRIIVPEPALVLTVVPVKVVRALEEYTTPLGVEEVTKAVVASFVLLSPVVGVCA